MRNKETRLEFLEFLVRMESRGWPRRESKRIFEPRFEGVKGLLIISRSEQDSSRDCRSSANSNVSIWITDNERPASYRLGCVRNRLVCLTRHGSTLVRYNRAPIPFPTQEFYPKGSISPIFHSLCLKISIDRATLRSSRNPFSIQEFYPKDYFST